jgi:imidazole glycerol-phosphate synthase subunit HisH
LDFGGGNLGSLVSALQRRGAEYEVSGDPALLERSGAAILPGDGAFGATMRALGERGLDVALRRFIASGRPLLGICVGMQVLYESSSEYGRHAGIGYFPGTVTRLANAPRVPHMGWNQLELVGEHPFTRGIEPGAYAYFLHSYAAPVGPATLAATTHGERFAAIVAQDNVMATQFHPEKSQTTGAVLLDNFLRIARA